MVKIEFLGAMMEVGASGMILDNGHERIVLDYGADTEEAPPRPPLPVGKKVDSLILSHAHLDHCGSIPMLMKKNPAMPIYGLPVTKELMEMILLDSLKINMQEMGGIEGAGLPFNKHDVSTTLRNFRPIQYKKHFKLKRANVTLYDAGHIPGSALTFVDFGERTAMYAGNYNSIDTRLLRKADFGLPSIGSLITESTYSDRDHADRKSQEKELIKSVEETLSNGGMTLISSFAIGRAQEILLILEEAGIDYPLYMDGMAKKATTIISRYKKMLADSKALDRALKKVQYVTSPRARNKSMMKPGVVITTSGMLEGGPVLSYMKKLHSDTKSTLLMTGYQAPGTAGKLLLETGRFVSEGIDAEVKMTVKKLDFSAHIGRKDLFGFIEKQNPEKVFCVHGDHTEDFARELREKGFNAIAPIANNRIYDI